MFSEKLCNIASHRVASHRVALTFDEDYKAFKKQKQGRPEYSLQRTPPPEKLPLHSLRFGSFLSSGTKWPTGPLGLSPEGGICVTYRSNPPTVTRGPRLRGLPF